MWTPLAMISTITSFAGAKQVRGPRKRMHRHGICSLTACCLPGPRRQTSRGLARDDRQPPSIPDIQPSAGAQREAPSGTLIFPLDPAYRCAHAGYLLPSARRMGIASLSLPPSGKSSLQIRAIPSHTEGRIAIVTNAGWGAVDAAAFCARWDRRAGSLETVSDHQVCRREMLLRTAKSCGPDAPDAGVKFAEFCWPNRAVTKPCPADDGGKRARSPGRARHKPLKPLRAGMRGDSGVLVVARVRSITPIAHETAGAAGIRHSPRPLLGAEDKCMTRALRVARAKSYADSSSLRANGSQ